MRRYVQNGKNTFIAYLRAIGFSVLISLALLLISCAAAYSTEDPASAAKGAALAALFVSAPISGLICAKITGGGVISGLTAGAVLSLILMIISISGYGGAEDVGASLLLYAVFISLCVIGGFLGRKKKLRKKKKPRVPNIR